MITDVWHHIADAWPSGWSKHVDMEPYPFQWRLHPGCECIVLPSFFDPVASCNPPGLLPKRQQAIMRLLDACHCIADYLVLYNRRLEEASHEHLEALGYALLLGCAARE